MKIKRHVYQAMCDFCGTRSEWFEDISFLDRWLEYDYSYAKPPYYDLVKYGLTFCSQEHRDLWIESQLPKV